jgi:hypothetical protein
MSNVFNPAIIPLFLEASTKEKLVELMYHNNAINGKMYNYMSPFKDGKKWVVWYYSDIHNDKRLTEADLEEFE